MTVQTVVDLRGDPNVTLGRLVVDEGHVYIDTNKGTMRIPKCGGVATKIADNAAGQYMASGIAQNARWIFLAASAPLKGGFVRRISKSATSPVTPSPIELASNARALFGLTGAPLDKVESLYWVARVEGADVLYETDVKTDDAAASIRSTRTLASLPIAYMHGPFIADSTGVSFFSMSRSNDGTYSTWSIASGLRSVATGPAAVDLVGSPAAAGAGASEMYFSFAHTTDNGVARLARTMTSQPAIVTGATGAAPHGLARQGHNLYFTDISRNTVTKCVLASSGQTCDATTAVAHDEDDPRFLAVDDTAVYWATYRGHVRRAPL